MLWLWHIKICCFLWLKPEILDSSSQKSNLRKSRVLRTRNESIGDAFKITSITINCPFFHSQQVMSNLLQLIIHNWQLIIIAYAMIMTYQDMLFFIVSQEILSSKELEIYMGEILTNRIQRCKLTYNLCWGED